MFCPNPHLVISTGCFEADATNKFVPDGCLGVNSRSAPVDPIAQECALAWRLSIQMRFPPVSIHTCTSVVSIIQRALELAQVATFEFRHSSPKPYQI